MSGLVKGVKKVFKATGIAKVGSAIVKTAKKIVKSKVFKVVAIAALAYFGGAAITSMAGGGTASAGIGSAWGGLQGAGSALASGNIGGAFSALGSGFTAAGATQATTFAGGQLAAQAAITGQTAAIGATSGAYTGKAMESFVAGGGNSVIGTATQAATPAVTQSAAAAASPGLLGGLGEAGKAAVITGGINMGGQMIQGYAAQKQAEEQAENRDYFGVNGKGVNSGLPGPGLLNPANIMPNNPVPQLQPLKSLDDLIARQQQTVNAYKQWGA